MHSNSVLYHEEKVTGFTYQAAVLYESVITHFCFVETHENLELQNDYDASMVMVADYCCDHMENKFKYCGDSRGLLLHELVSL